MLVFGALKAPWNQLCSGTFLIRLVLVVGMVSINISLRLPLSTTLYYPFNCVLSRMVQLMQHNLLL